MSCGFDPKFEVGGVPVLTTEVMVGRPHAETVFVMVLMGTAVQFLGAITRNCCVGLVAT